MIRSHSDSSKNKRKVLEIGAGEPEQCAGNRKVSNERKNMQSKVMEENAGVEQSFSRIARKSSKRKGSVKMPAAWREFRKWKFAYPSICIPGVLFKSDSQSSDRSDIDKQQILDTPLGLIHMATHFCEVGDLFCLRRENKSTPIYVQCY